MFYIFIGLFIVYMTLSILIAAFKKLPEANYYKSYFTTILLLFGFFWILTSGVYLIWVGVNAA